MFRLNRLRTHEEQRKVLKLELQIRSSLYRLSALIKTMNDELSLLPVSHLRWLRDPRYKGLRRA